MHRRLPKIDSFLLNHPLSLCLCLSKGEIHSRTVIAVLLANNLLNYHLPVLIQRTSLESRHVSWLTSCINCVHTNNAVHVFPSIRILVTLFV